MIESILKLFKKKETWTPRKVWNLKEHQRGWGHNVYFCDWDNRRIVGHHPNRRDWKVGDELRCKMDSQKIARFKIIEFEATEGVDDMFFLKVEDVGYVGEEK